MAFGKDFYSYTKGIVKMYTRPVCQQAAFCWIFKKINTCFGCGRNENNPLLC